MGMGSSGAPQAAKWSAPSAWAVISVWRWTPPLSGLDGWPNSDSTSLQKLLVAPQHQNPLSLNPAAGVWGHSALWVWECQVSAEALCTLAVLPICAFDRLCSFTFDFPLKLLFGNLGLTALGEFIDKCFGTHQLDRKRQYFICYNTNTWN